MSIAEKLTTIAENMQKVYDAGKASAGDSGGYEEGYSQAESDFWDAFQQNGNRTFYEYGFCNTAFEPLRPKHKVVPTSRTICMFEYANVKKIEKAYFDFSKASVTSQGGSSTSGYYATFRYCYELEEIEDVGMPAGGLYNTFNRCHNLHTISILRVLENTGFNGTFSHCFALENITIDGVIGQNGLVLSDSTKLTHDSLMSIITALKDYSTDTSGTQWVVTLGTTNLNKLTDAQKAMATQKGWTLA